MNFKKFALTAGCLLVVLVLGMNSDIFAQGRGGGRGGGGGRPTTSGMGNVNRGIITSSERSNGRSDDGLTTASRNSNGRSDDGLNRARTGGGNRNLPDNDDLLRSRGIARKLNTTPETLRSRYQTALAANPDLKWGQFVAANVIANNLSRRNPNITASAILAGLESGDSIGRTLRNLGLSSDAAKQAEKDANRQIKESKKSQ